MTSELYYRTATSKEAIFRSSSVRINNFASNISFCPGSSVFFDNLFYDFLVSHIFIFICLALWNLGLRNALFDIISEIRAKVHSGCLHVRII
jgi:hypothetical protein